MGQARYIYILSLDLLINDINNTQLCHRDTENK